MLQQREIDELVQKAVDVLPKAYCIYSNFPVGAALMCETGDIFVGGRPCGALNIVYGQFSIQLRGPTRNAYYTEFYCTLKDNRTKYVVSSRGLAVLKRSK